MDTYYLVDYENVGSKAFDLCKSMKATDHIIVFFSINAKSIDMRKLTNTGKASIQFIEVIPGKESLDLHIVTSVGYLIGKSPDYIIKIVSKDKGYDKIIKFWKTYKGVNLSRVATIKSTAKEKAVTPVSYIDPKTKLNNDLQGALKRQSVVPIAEAVTTIMFATEKFRSSKKVYDHIVKQYGRHRGLEIYSLTKNIIKDALK